MSFECSEMEAEMLSRSVNDKEVQDVVFAMPRNKAPGPDGYTAEFFRESWLIVGKDVVVAVQSFFDKGFLPKGIIQRYWHLYRIKKKQEK